jgi:hypothetical protein
MLVIKQDTNLETLRDQLLVKRVSEDKAATAIDSLQKLNPHVDLKKLTPGTVLLVPETTSFKLSASDPMANDVVGEFQQLVRSGFEAAAAKLKNANDAGSAADAEVAAVLKTAAVKRILESDAELKEQAEEALNGFKEDQEQGEQAAQSLERAAKGALAELAALSKLLR